MISVPVTASALVYTQKGRYLFQSGMFVKENIKTSMSAFSICCVRALLVTKPLFSSVAPKLMIFSLYCDTSIMLLDVGWLGLNLLY